MSMQTKGPPSSIAMYVPINPLMYETDYLMATVMSAVPRLCMRHIAVFDRNEAATAIRNLADYHQPSMILVATFGITPEEKDAIEAAGSHARKLIVFHLSDEELKHDTSWYPSVKAVFRNYYSAADQLHNMTQYLSQAIQTSKSINDNGDAQETPTADADRGAILSPQSSRVYWYPLGHGNHFRTADSMMLATADRPLLWSWSGSTGLKPERDEMIKVLDCPQLLEHGHLKQFLWFLGDGKLDPFDYSRLMYQSMLVPVPAGINAEQFRLWEAFRAGAIPIIHKQHAAKGLAHVDLLGFKALWIDAWSDAACVMQEVWDSAERQSELAAWQQHNQRVLQRIYAAIAEQVASTVCECE